MKFPPDSHPITRDEFLAAVPSYSGSHGYPTFGDIKPYLPDYYVYTNSWEAWDLCNKSSVFLKWVSKKDNDVFLEQTERELNAASKQREADEAANKRKQESDRQERLHKNTAKQESESAKRLHGASIVAMQTECSNRKAVDALVEQANELVLSAGKLVSLLKRIPAERRSEVDIEAFHFNSGRVSSIIPT